MWVFSDRLDVSIATEAEEPRELVPTIAPPSEGNRKLLYDADETSEKHPGAELDRGLAWFRKLPLTATERKIGLKTGSLSEI